jgi:hypothetical protein
VAARRLGALLLVAAMACATHRAPRVAPPSPPPLHLTPLADLVPAAGLLWIVDLRPRELFANPALIPALQELFPEAELDLAARDRGGLDLRSMDAFVAAGYDPTTLYLAHQVLEPARIEAAFARRVAEVQGRAIDRTDVDPRGVLVRSWGARGTSKESVVTFGREAAGLALGSDTRLRAAELFAEGRLAEAKPAWRTVPLDRVAELLGDAPVRGAAPGPFEGSWSLGLGGLLATATGAGFAARVDGAALHLSVVLTGAWADRSPEALARLRGCYEALAHSGLGLLLGLSHPASPPTYASAADHVSLAVGLEVAPLARGLADATVSQLRDIMRSPGAP